MPRLPTAKHPEFSRRNAMVISCVDLDGLEAAMDKFDICKSRVYQIVGEYRGVRNRFKKIHQTEAIQILTLYNTNSMAKVAKLMGRDKKTIKRFLKRYGVSISRKGWKVTERKKSV